MMFRRVIALCLICPILGTAQSSVVDWITKPYRAKTIPPVNYRNSSRLGSLIRGGNLYLNLADAVALAIENNLDVEVERYLPQAARSDILRAKGGGLPRGLSLLEVLPPPGIGGPNGPLLTNLTAGSLSTPLINTNFSDLALISRQQNNLSILGTNPLVSGPPVPQFDPIITGLEGWLRRPGVVTNPITGVTTPTTVSTTINTIGLVKGFAPGTQIGTSLANPELQNPFPTSINVIANATLVFTISQPLLRGFGSRLNRRFIYIARNNLTISELVFRQQLIDTVAGVTRLYIDLVSLNEDVKVKEQSLRLAQRLYQDNKNKVDQGTLAPIELTRAQAQVAASQQALVQSQGLVRQQELIVLTVLTRRGLATPSLLALRILPTDVVKGPGADLMPPVEDLIAEALHKRPDLASAGVQVENSRINLDASRKALLPELDIIAFFQSGTLGGATGVVGPVGTGPGPSNQIYGAGVELSLPLRNRVAQGDAIRDAVDLRQTQVRRQQLDAQIRLEVANALVSVESARAAYAAAVQTRVLQEQSVNVEQQKFNVGLSTTYLVTQFEAYLAQARSTEVAAKAAYAKARVALDRATARILEVSGISFDEAYEGHISRPPARLP